MASIRKPALNPALKEAIRIDWSRARKEADDLLKSSINLPWDDKMYRVEVAYEIIRLCNNADTYAYLDALDKYRSLLKGG